MFQDPFFLRVINRADFKGTKEDPIIVNALDSARKPFNMIEFS